MNYKRFISCLAFSAISFASLEINPAQAAFSKVKNNSYQLPNQVTSVVQKESLSYKPKNLQQGQRTKLQRTQSNLIAQAYPSTFSTYYLTTTTNSNGFFSVQHSLGSKIYGMVVAIQHVNGNWHTIDVSNAYDHRFWWNTQRVEGMIANPVSFPNRPVRIILFVYPWGRSKTFVSWRKNDGFSRYFWHRREQALFPRRRVHLQQSYSKSRFSREFYTAVGWAMPTLLQNWEVVFGWSLKAFVLWL